MQLNANSVPDYNQWHLTTKIQEIQFRILLHYYYMLALELAKVISISVAFLANRLAI